MIISIDFDHTLYDTREKESHLGPLKGEPEKGAFEAIDALLSEGNDVQIFTARTDLQRVKAWIKSHGYDFDVSNTKKPADIYIDDRSIPFRGDWEQTLNETEAFMQELGDTRMGV